MSPVGPGRCGGETVLCRCMLCGYEIELQEGQKCDDTRCPCCNVPLSPDTRIAQKTPRGGPGRREEEEAKIGPDGWEPPWWPPGNGEWPPWEPKPPLLLTKECRCPSCDFTTMIEEGARCLLTDCPNCGEKMVDVS